MAPAKRVLLEICGPDTSVDQIDRQMLKDARDVLLDLPPRVRHRFPDSTLVEAAAVNRLQNGPRLSAKTVDNQIVWISAFFAFAEREQLVIKSPARQLGLGASRGSAPTRFPWSVKELNLLFRSATFTSGQGRPAEFWVPLLALFQGLRMNEACQLYSDDLIDWGGVPALRVASDPDRSQFTKKNDTRIVPVHPTLIGLGIENLFRRTNEPTSVFPSIARDRHGMATNAFSKRFKRIASAAGIARSGVVFHSFRHNFADALRHANVPDEVADALGGWHARGSARSGYGQGHRPDQLLRSLAAVEFVGLELGFLKPTF